MWLSSLIIILIINFYREKVLASANLYKYKSYKKYMIQYNDEAIRDYFIDLQQTNTELDFWQLGRNRTTIAVDAFKQTAFENLLHKLHVNYERSSLLDELQAINNTVQDDTDNTIRKKRQTRGFFTRYPRYQEIINYMKILVQRYPQNCRLETLGRSYEGRSIAALSISSDNRLRAGRVAYIQGGVHAREWMTPLTILYFAAELLTNLRYFQSILKNVDITLVPLVNPDGYEYSVLGDPYWRKNRRSYFTSGCSGVDLNRNFPNHWSLYGSSNRTCSEIFAGAGPASEPETTAVIHYLQNNRKRIKLVLDVHSYGGYIFYPYSYSRNTYATTRSFLHSVATRAASQISKYRGTLFRVGTAADLLYEASGGIDDYAYANLAIPMVFTMELSGNSFHVPSTQIIHVCKETFAGFVELTRHVSLF